MKVAAMAGAVMTAVKVSAIKRDLKNLDILSSLGSSRLYAANCERGNNLQFSLQANSVLGSSDHLPSRQAHGETESGLNRRK
jgi:hypothetical protein